jgi:hypothetical protein
MQNGKWMIREEDFNKLKELCADKDGNYNIVLCKKIFVRWKKLPSRDIIESYIRW